MRSRSLVSNSLTRTVAAPACDFASASGRKSPHSLRGRFANDDVRSPRSPVMARARPEAPVFTKRTQFPQSFFWLAHFTISLSSWRDWRNNACTRRRLTFASRVKRPCLRAFLFPSGAPDPGAPPCIRQRRFPLTAGDRQNPPRRFRAPQRGLESIGSVLRL